MNGYTPGMARAAVERGAAWLDERCTNWTNHIDMETLDLRKPEVCVLGQTAECLVGDKRRAPYESGFWRVRRALKLRDDEWCASHGFDVPDAGDVNEYSEDGEREYGARYEVLTLTWRAYIRERLAVSS